MSATAFSIDGGATLNLTNASGINGSSANANLTLAGSGTGNIGGPLALGTGNLIVSGGTWTVAPNNSYSGLTTINGGALLITAPLSLSQPPASFNASQVTLNGGTLGTATNITLNDGKIGIDLSANSTIAVNNTNATLTISNDIGGNASLTLTKTGPGTLVLNGANDFGGTLNMDSGSNTTNDGTTVIANNAAIANILAVPGTPLSLSATTTAAVPPLPWTARWAASRLHRTSAWLVATARFQPSKILPATIRFPATSP